MAKEADLRPGTNVFATTVGDNESNTGELKVRTPKAQDLSSVASDASKRAEQLANIPRTGRRPKITNVGITKRSFRLMGPEGRSHFEQAVKYHSARCQTLYVNFGHVSECVSLMVANSATQNAIARWYQNRGIELEDMALVDKGVKYQNSARQMELSAWEMCAREAKAYRELRDQGGGINWGGDNAEQQLPRSVVKKHSSMAKFYEYQESKAQQKVVPAEPAQPERGDNDLDTGSNEGGPDSGTLSNLFGTEGKH